MSRPEQILYQRLIRAFPQRVVLSQVALPAFLGVIELDDRTHDHPRTAFGS